MDHSYEEIRAAALDVLAGREPTPPYEPVQYENLSIAIAEAFFRREQPQPPTSRPAQHLSFADRELFLEVFWDLFRQSLITLGMNDNNREFPFFRLSRFGKQIIGNQDTYFFHDVSSYKATLEREIRAIDPVTLTYALEAMQAFRSGCLLSATVMLGVAAEDTLLGVLDAAAASPTYGSRYSGVSKERGVLNKANKFRRLLEQDQKAFRET